MPHLPLIGVPFRFNNKEMEELSHELVNVPDKEIPKVFILREQFDKLDEEFIKTKELESGVQIVPIDAEELERMKMNTELIDIRVPDIELPIINYGMPIQKPRKSLMDLEKCQRCEHRFGMNSKQLEWCHKHMDESRCYRFKLEK